ncbi:MAG: CpsD/CapB family tyrosine-protein kinase [Clostridiales bacterium]|nr:CpsD/CapB family tyrosine-protein kinase [Clostridiales bacterium]
MNEKLRVGSGRNVDLAIASIFGKLKANIDFSFVEEKHRTIIFSSALPNEGKTTIAVNVAAAMAAADKKTLFLDADMRNPTAHQLFSIVNTRGLSDIISQGADWRQFVFKAKVPNLYVITAGRKPSNPSRFLSSERFHSLLTELSAEFDYIILDTPPILLVPDTQIISAHADGVVLVIKNGKTSRDSVKEAHETLLRANANVIGAVLNHAGKKESIYGYGYGVNNRTPGRPHGAPPKRPTHGTSEKPVPPGVKKPAPVSK